MSYNNFKTYPISKSPLQKYLDMFNIKLDSLNFKELYFITKIGWFTSKEFLSQYLFFIQLEQNIDTPTSFCYRFLKEKCKNTQILEITSVKWANEFLYSKDLPIQHSITNSCKRYIKELDYFLIEFNESIIGVGRVERGEKFLLNIENISTYLFEDK